MEWESAKKHCEEKNWQWSLNFIIQAKREMEELEAEIQKLKAEKIFGSPAP